MPQSFAYGKDRLTASVALALARGERRGELTPTVRRGIEDNARVVAEIAAGPAAVYGINTGFGPLCTTRVDAAQTGRLQENLLKSHAVGVGESLEPLLVRLMLVQKVHALARGRSGVRLTTVERIIWFLENEVTPVVPSQGSVGASGDLAPLAHLFLPLIGLGRVSIAGEVELATSLVKTHGIQPLELGPKEGLGLINGTQFIAAHATLVVEKLAALLDQADLIGCMMLEGLLGSGKPFAAELHALRPFPGTSHVAARLRHLLTDSEVLASHADCGRVQDPYSLRCMPQVHGASRAAWAHLRDLLEIELNSVTDNPVIFATDHTISGGNFHGQPLAMALDYATLAAAELGNISDRRSYLALTGEVANVPKLLIREAGTNSGFMIPQYTAAALVSENKSLCFPASADSIPTSLGQEDHVSMGSISGRKALQVVRNVEKILAIELYGAAQALDFHAPLRTGPILQKLHARVRQDIEHLSEDRLMQPDLEAAISLVRSGTLLELAGPIPTDWSDQFDNW